MDVKPSLKGQYHAALAMVRQAVERCPDDVWFSGEPPREFWRIAYHPLYYLHLYIQPSEHTFVPWPGSRPWTASLWPEEGEPSDVVPYTKNEILEYARVCEEIIDPTVDSLDLEAQECGFHWYHMPKLDHQIMNIRHVQQHAGQLSELLYAQGIDLDWFGRR